MKAKPALKIIGALTLVGSLAAGAYYYVFVRSRKPQVELYFDDGSMLAMPGESEEASPFLAVAAEVLADDSTDE